MAFFPNCTVDITRKTKTGTSDTGNEITATETIEEDLHVSLKKYEPVDVLNKELAISDMGQIDVPLFILTCTTFLDIKKFDDVEIITSNVVNLVAGDVLTVIEEPYVGTLIKHVNAICRKGTK